MKKKYKIIGISLIAIFISIYLLISYIRGGSNELVKNDTNNIYVDDNEEIEKEEITETSSDDNLIVVEIKGEVKNPKVYYVKEGCIIEELIKEAGGLTEKADIGAINRAEEVTNHQCIVIPDINNKNKVDIETIQPSAGNITNNDGKININTATSEELQSLSGIGEAKAAAIIEYRESNGKFKAIEDITNVSGIGEASYAKIKEKITI